MPLDCTLGRSCACALLAGMCWLALVQPLPAQTPFRPSAARSTRDEALRSIPYDQLDAGGKEKVSAVLSNVSLYRRLPTQVVRCDADLYLFMIEHPDVTVNIWEVLGITQMTLQRSGPTTFRANDGSGTKGDIEFLCSTPDTHLLYTVGTYEGPLFHKPVKGGCLLLLKSAYARDESGRSQVTSQLDLFFNVEHVGLEILTKTFQPLVGKAADYNFIESNNFLGSLSKTGETKPAAMQQLASRLNSVSPEDRQEFAQLMAAIPQKAAERQAALAKMAPPMEAPRPRGPGAPNLRR